MTRCPSRTNPDMFFLHAPIRAASLCRYGMFMKRRAAGIAVILVVLLVLEGISAPSAPERVEVEPDSKGPARAVIDIANAERSARGLGRLEEQEPCARRPNGWPRIWRGTTPSIIQIA